VNIAGTYSPPYGFEKDEQEIEKINAMLIQSKADILFVGMGVPKQDIFVFENMAKHKIPVSVSVGAGIDFIAGDQKRAPKWMSSLGLEWFFRFCNDPKRLFKRYFIDDIKILGLILKYQ
jgi:N-acetylglucosaminyldiphosphoundecaprenol N-acetyl-beta-D-mannosaminyltransferase